MNTANLLRLAPIALLLAFGSAQARTFVAPHVFEAKVSGCAKGQHIPQATLTPARAASRTESCDDGNVQPAADTRLRESPSRPSLDSSKKEFKGHVTLLK